jgi:hypothetical protein
MRDSRRSLTLNKGRDRFVFRYAAGQESALLTSLVELARDPETRFDWLDAAVLSYQMGRQMRQEEELDAVG